MQLTILTFGISLLKVSAHSFTRTERDKFAKEVWMAAFSHSYIDFDEYLKSRGE
jgi:hypothetical protein